MKLVSRLVLVTAILFYSVVAHAESIELATGEYPPYVSENFKNQGFMTEIIVTAFNQKGYDVKTRFLPWQRAFDSTKAGKYKGIYTMWYREDREEWFAFSDSLPPTEIGFMKLTENDITFESYSDVKSLRIGVVRGYASPVGFDEAGLTTHEVVEDRLNISKLLLGRVDLVLIDKITGQHILNTEYADRKGEVNWLVSLQIDPQHLAFSKKAPGYEKLLHDFNRGLKVITDNGSVAKILASHGF